MDQFIQSGTVNMNKNRNYNLRIAVGTGVLILSILGGVVGLTSVLDHYGFGPNAETQQDRIEKNLRQLQRLE